MSRFGASVTARVGAREATGLAVVVAILFALTGPLIEALLAAGWSAGAVAVARIWGAAVVMLLVAAVFDRRRLRIRRHHFRDIAAYGIGAVAIAQVGLILALRTLSISLAVSIQFLACVVVVAWEWARSRRRPTAPTLLGTVLAISGLIMVLNPFQSQGIDWGGVGWAFASMLGFAVFVVAPATPNRPSALSLGAWGMVIGGLVVALFAVTGVLPVEVSGESTAIAGNSVAAPLTLIVLVLASSVAPHLLTITVAARLGATKTSLLLLSEVLITGVLAWALRGQPLTAFAVVGGLCLCSGICVAQIGDTWLRKRRIAPSPDLVGLPEK